MMVFFWTNSVLYAGSICLIAFSAIDKSHSLPTTTSPRPDPLNYTCTDCCDLLTCMGLDNMITGDVFEFLCSETSIAISPTCFTKHNLNHCTNMKRLVPLLPSTDKIAEEFPQFCKQKEDMKAIQSCLTNSIVGVDILDRCTTPYMNGLKDINSTVCETTDIMTQCVLAVLKITNCSDMIGKNYEQSMKLQKQYNPLCANASAQMCTVLYIVIVSLMLMWNKML
ncbi:Hypothetical predicted protein [Mytilus galloprovincialis]|uniref:Uncharacterized protein n=2 Tax=Mytilus galloprovincialis TaxID=29158 RepID=A0A8B6CSW4_MYTGA|nr:Hypothetical predicted protein [Mytilus galloprovincialis]